MEGAVWESSGDRWDSGGKPTFQRKKGWDQSTLGEGEPVKDLEKQCPAV